MRTLKKTLCLVLSVVMVLGLFAMSVSAAPDDDKVSAEYKTAVAVMEAVKALQGVDDAGNLNPKAELTRIEGAVIIARLLGYLDETRLDGTKATMQFTDIPTWAGADGAVALMLDRGVTDGVSDTEFGSASKLSGDMFAKWLFCALGYNAEKEGMTGADWEIAVNKLLMREAALDSGVTNYPQTTPLTREQAAQMMLNALKTKTVDYNSNTTVTVGGGSSTTVTVGGDRYYVTADTTGNANSYATKISATTESANKAYVELGEKLYNGKLALNTTGVDDYGKAIAKWTYPSNSTTVAKETTADIVATYTKASDLTGKNLAALGDWAAQGDNATLKNLAVYANGHDTYASGTVYTIAVDTVIRSTNGAKVVDVPNGAKVEIADNDRDGEIDRIFITYGLLGKVTKVNPATATVSRSVELSVYNAKSGSLTPIKAYETEKFAKDDYVIVYPDAAWNFDTKAAEGLSGTTEAISVEAATPVNGTVTKYTGSYGVSIGTASTVGIDGTDYNVGGLLGTAAPTVTVGKTTADIYVLNDYVIGIIAGNTATTDLSKLVYVISSDVTDSVNTTTGVRTNYIRVIRLSTGALEVIQTTGTKPTVNNVTGFYQLNTNSTTGYQFVAINHSLDDTGAANSSRTKPTSLDVYAIGATATPDVYSATGFLSAPESLKATDTQLQNFVYITVGDTAAITTTSNEVKPYITSTTKFIFIKNGTASATNVVNGPIAYNVPANSPVVVSKDSRGNYVVDAVIIKGTYTAAGSDSKIVYLAGTGTYKIGEDADGDIYRIYNLDGTSETPVIDSMPDDATAHRFYTYSTNADGLGVLSDATDWSSGSIVTGQLAGSTDVPGEQGGAATVFVDPNDATMLLTVADTNITNIDVTDAAFLNLISSGTGSTVTSITGLQGNSIASVNVSIYLQNNKAVLVVLNTAA